IRPTELQLPVPPSFHAIAPLVDRAMMAATAREAAAAIAMQQGASSRRRDRPCPRSDLSDSALGIMPHHHGLASQAGR
ncbi:MAG TPA: hypothetical protein VHT71_19810, partial [Methylomirabilota bacterium]|nr:hypothetical protein [Methylomirabilota bacterium]